MVATPTQLADTLGWLATDPVSRARTGRTSHAVIFRDQKAVVRYFAPERATRPPLFCVMPLINTWTVFDLLPGRSVVQALTAAGVPVYVLDWGRAGPEDRTVPMSHYVDTVLGRCLRRAVRHAGVEQIDVLGYCVGGTFLALHLARNPGPARRAYLLATPVDFSEASRLAAWSRPETFPLEAIVAGFGNFPRALMAESFRWLRPTGGVAKWKAVLDRGHDPAFRELWCALESWNGDGVDFPGAAYGEYIRGCYMDNATMAGGWVMGGRAVDLGQAKLPAHAVAASEDHIVPVAASHGLTRAWGGPVTTEVLRGGHVGICAGSALPASILAWLAA
jgi:polyhydroxyalkanoate synthase